MITQLVAGLVLAASLLFFITGACLFLKSKKNKVQSGVDVGEFISAQYMYDDVPFSAGISKKMLMRRLDMRDLASLGDVPNWLMMMLNGDVKDIEEAKKALEKKTEKELFEETKKYYDMLQEMAERTFVRWPEYVSEWKKVDPEYTGKFRKETLDYVFAKQMEPAKKIIKKKVCYQILQSLAKGAVSHQTTSQASEKKDS